MKKKMLAVLLSVCMLAGMVVCPTNVQVKAEDYTENVVEPLGDELTYGDFSYTVKEDGTVEITDYTGTETDLEIPSEIDGISVTSLGYGAFAYCVNINSIEISSGITKIGNRAFEQCTSLQSILIADSVIEIGDYAFASCESLKNIVIPFSVTEIGEHAFITCSSLNSITISSNVKKIGDGAFSNCSGLNEIIVDEANVMYSSESGILYDKAKSEILCCPKGKYGEVVILSSVKKIAASAFDGCSNVEGIMIPDGVMEIGGFAFSGCTNLKELVIPKSVTYIGERAFYDCENLSKIVIPDGITHINKYTFSGCDKLTDITIPSSVTNIEYGAFYDCKSLSSITIPDKVTVIARWTFYNCLNLNNIRLSKTITCIEKGAFTGCENLKDVYYAGTEVEWKTIQVLEENENLSKAIIYYNSVQSDTTDMNQVIAPSTKEDIQSGVLGKVNVMVNSKTYNGKPQTPSITVTDTNGQPVDASNYTVTYANNKNVGQATVTVTGTGNYTGTVTAHFTIIPKGTTLSKITAKKKAFAVKWKKQTKQVTGYELQYSTSKKFKGAKSVTIKKNKTTSSTVKKLKAKKKYFVRIRTYKTVKMDGKSKKLYSAWSKAKTVKTKK